MIVSFATIKCGRLFSFFQQVVETCEIQLPIYFFLKAVIVEETFWNCYVNVGKKFF